MNQWYNKYKAIVKFAGCGKGMVIIMTTAKERAVDIISHMSEDKVYYVLQLLEGIEGLTGKNPETDSMNISVDKGYGRRLGPLAGGLVFMADDFDETPDCFKEYM